MRSLIMRASICSSLSVLALPGCASPQPAATTTASTVPAPLTESQKARRLIDQSIDSGQGIQTNGGQTLICRQESVTNTRLKNRKICLTQEQWTARTDNAKDGFKEAKDAGDIVPRLEGDH